MFSALVNILEKKKIVSDKELDEDKKLKKFEEL